jgi:hypothetical protein
MTLKLVITFDKKNDSNVSGTATFMKKNGEINFVAISGLKAWRSHS